MAYQSEQNVLELKQFISETCLTQDGWAGRQEEMDFNIRLSFSEEEDSEPTSSINFEELGVDIRAQGDFARITEENPDFVTVNTNFSTSPSDEILQEKSGHFALTVSTWTESKSEDEKIYIVDPGSNSHDVKLAVKAFSKGENRGVVFDKTKITLSENKQYIVDQDYKRYERIGTGSCGDVYRAKDLKTQLCHAEKVQDFDSDSNQILFMYNFKDDPHFPDIYLANRNDGNKKLLHMELLDGKTLQNIINHNRKSVLNDSQVSAMWLPFCLFVLEEALICFDSYASRKWSHGDINCSNMLLLRNFDLLITSRMIDFEVAEDCSEEISTHRFSQQTIYRDFKNLFVAFVYLLSSQEFLTEHILDCYYEINPKMLPCENKLVKKVMDKAKGVTHLDDVKLLREFISKIKKDQLLNLNLSEKAMKITMIQRIFGKDEKKLVPPSKVGSVSSDLLGL